MINIPNFDTFELKHVVCDYNGTIAKDGILIDTVAGLFERLSENYTLHVITADTFGSVKAQLSGFDVTIKILSSRDHTQEKADYISLLGASSCVSLGNGNNDAKMLEISAIGIAIIGDEGCAKDSMLASDIIVKNITDGLELTVNTKRLIATLRR